jgi:uncharacterized protein
MSLRALGAVGVGSIALLVLALGLSQVPAVAAGGLLHPARRTTYAALPERCAERAFAGDGVTLRGWQCATTLERRGIVVYLHGVADNRSSAAGIIGRLTRRGFDVIAYDSRAHGQSDGDVCTYGFYEKRDLQRIVETLPPAPVVLIGNSLGAAVALQAAVVSRRVAGVVAAEVFSDLRTIAAERAPGFLPGFVLEKAFQVAEARGRFDAGQVSAVDAAKALTIPVLLIHGERDIDTVPAHSRRVFAALAGPKRLILVAEAGHNQALHDVSVWLEIDRFLERASHAHAVSQ